MAFTPTEEAQLRAVITAFESGKTISEIAASTEVFTTDVLEIVQSAVSKRATIAQIVALVNSELGISTVSSKLSGLDAAIAELDSNIQNVNSLNLWIPKNAVATKAALVTTYPAPAKNWAAMVLADGYVYINDGLGVLEANWVNSGQKAFPTDVVTIPIFGSILYPQIDGNKTIDIANTYPALLWLQDAIKDCRMSTNFDYQEGDMIVIGTIDSTVIEGETNIYLMMGYNRGSRLISWNLNIPLSQVNQGTILKRITAQSDDLTKSITLEILADWSQINPQSGSFGFLNMNWALAKNHPLLDLYLNESKIAEKKSKKTINSILVMGDSISSDVDNGWMKEIIDEFEIQYYINTACGSGRIKDDSIDIITNPYTNRPVHHLTGVNKNVFHSQILKIQRLMAGIDLDAGESRIYTSEDQYPNIIFIEGGTNDSPDSDEIMSDITTPFYKHLSNQWVYNGYGGLTSGNEIDITKPLSEVDKTTFYGSTRFLVETLQNMFPLSQIMFIAPAQKVGIGKDTEIQIKKAEQIEKAANRLSCACVNWSKYANIIDINNKIKGKNPDSGQTEGSELNPWFINGSHYIEKDLYDGTHPNASASKKMGRIVVNSIYSYYIS